MKSNCRAWSHFSSINGSTRISLENYIKTCTGGIAELRPYKARVLLLLPTCRRRGGRVGAAYHRWARPILLGKAWVVWSGLLPVPLLLLWGAQLLHCWPHPRKWIHACLPRGELLSRQQRNQNTQQKRARVRGDGGPYAATRASQNAGSLFSGALERIKRQETAAGSMPTKNLSWRLRSTQRRIPLPQRTEKGLKLAASARVRGESKRSDLEYRGEISYIFKFFHGVTHKHVHRVVCVCV